MSTATLTAEGRINGLVREAAQLLVNATSLSQRLPADHPLCRALAALAEVDQATARAAREIHWPALFEPCRLATPPAPDLDYPYVRDTAP